MSVWDPNLEERKNLSNLLKDWIAEEFCGITSRAEEACGIARSTLSGYIKPNGTGWPGEEHKVKLAQAMGLSFQELNAKIADVDLEADISLDRLIEQIRLRDDQELILIDRVIADVRESRLAVVYQIRQVLNK